MIINYFAIILLFKKKEPNENGQAGCHGEGVAIIHIPVIVLEIVEPS